MSHFGTTIPLVALSVWLVACVDPCESRVLWELRAPRGLPKSSGNIFVADNDHGVAKDLTVTTRWTAPDQLVIRYPVHARVFRREARANGVAVTYETVP